MSRYSEYSERAATGGVQLPWRHELVDPVGKLLATTDETAATGDVIHWGAQAAPLDFNSDRVSQRSATLTLPDKDRDLVPKSPGSPLHPDSGNKIRLSAGLFLADGTVRMFEQATMLPDTVSGAWGQGVVGLTIPLLDTLRPIRSELSDSFAWDRGETVEAVVERLVSQVITDPVSIAATGYTMPGGSLSSGTSRYDAINAMLEGCGHELVAGQLGSVFSRPILPSAGNNLAERWVYGLGGIPVDSAVRVWSSRVPRVWQIKGGSLQTSSASFEFRVYDRDPASEGYFSGPGEVRIETASYPYIEETPQAAVAGYAQMRRRGTGPMVLDLRATPNPALVEGDIIDLDLPSLHAVGTFRLLSYVLPLQVDGLMTMRVRQLWDPSLGFESPLDVGAGCKVSASDSFDRPDENLENASDGIGSLPGSADWTEIGYSWGVVNNRAVQRSQGSWSLAFVNTPMCGTDQEATIQIASIPSGRRIGPVVRCSGEMDGYAALMDSSGRVTLETWQAGQSTATLASHSTGQDPTGKSVTIRAVGQTVIVKIGGTEVISQSNDEKTGAHTGMLAYGGPAADPPSAESFLSETI